MTEHLTLDDRETLRRESRYSGSITLYDAEHVVERIVAAHVAAARADAERERDERDNLRARAEAAEAVVEQIKELRLDVEHSRSARDEDPVITLRDGTPADVGALLRIILDQLARAEAAEAERDEAQTADGRKHD